MCPRVHGVVEGGGVGGVKPGRFVIFRFPLFCSVWGPRYADAEKNSTKNVIVCFIGGAPHHYNLNQDVSKCFFSTYGGTALERAVITDISSANFTAKSYFQISSFEISPFRAS